MADSTSTVVKTGRFRLAVRGLVFAALALASMLPAGPSIAQFIPNIPVIPPRRERLPGPLTILNWYLSSGHRTQFRLVYGGIPLYSVQHRLCNSYGDHCSGWVNFGRAGEIRFPNGSFAVGRGGRWQSQVRPAVPGSIISTVNYNTMPPDARPSGAPEYLSASQGRTAAGNRTARLSWRHAPGATHYQVRVCLATRNGAGVYTKGRCNLRGGGRDSEGWLPRQRAGPDAATQHYTVSPLFGGSHYFLQVRGTNNHGTGSLAEVAISTPPVTPLAPTGLSLSSASNTTATVAWRPVTGASRYQARTCAATRSGNSYARGACGSWTSDLNATSHTFTGLSLTATGRVFVQVRAISSASGAAPGSPAQLLVFLRVPDAPSSVWVSEVTPTTAILAWGAATRAARYQVRTCAATRSGNSYTRGTCGSWTSDLNAANHTFTGLSQTTSYMLQVRGSNASGVGPPREIGIHTYNNRCAAADICVSARSHHSLTVEWDPSSHGELVWICRFRGAGSQCRPGYDNEAYSRPANGTYSHTFSNLLHDTEYTVRVGYLRPSRWRWGRWIYNYRYWRTFTARGTTEAYRLPAANAGADQTANEGQKVTLSGSGTLSPDRPGQTLRYTWSQTAGPTVTLSSSTAQNPAFDAPVQLARNTTLTFSLVVNDGLVYSLADTVDVAVAAGVNDAPTADAGADQRVAEGVTVTLDASASTDPENAALTYAWTQTSGPTATLSSASAAGPTFDAPAVTADATLEFSLTVTDLGGLTSTDTVSVTVLDGENSAPTADAGDSQTVAEGATVTLDGSDSSDLENHVIRYAWTQTGGPTVTLSAAAAETPTFTAPQVVAGDNVLTFSLTVNDYLQDSEADSATVTVTPGENDAPTADAGDSQTVDEGAAATLDASASSDPENRELFYEWTQTAGPTVALSSPTAAAPTFLAPDVNGNVTLTFSLTVNDGIQDSAADTVNVTVRGDANAAPTANAGSDQTVAENATVTLDGSASTDPETSALTYAWTQTGGTPAVTLSSASAAAPTFTAPDVPADTVLTFSLIVVDAHGTPSPPDAVAVTVTVANDAPTADAGADQTVNQGATVTLDGSASSDPQTSALTYAWTQTGGTPTVTLSSQSVAAPTFTAPDVTVDTVLTFSLTVNDGVSDSAADAVDVTVNGDAPTANAGADQTVAEGATVTLAGGASSDPGNRPLVYSWTQTAGTTVTLSGTPSAPTFTAPDLKTTAILTFSLTVTAAGTTSVSAADAVNVTVTADDDAPTANAGPDQTVNERETVTLDGGASSDPENAALTYAWTQTAGTTVTLSSSSAAAPTFTAPTLTANATLTFSLTVNDGVSDSVADTVDVAVNNLPRIRVTARTATSVSVAWDRQGGSYKAQRCYWNSAWRVTACNHATTLIANTGSHTFSGLNNRGSSYHTDDNWELRILFYTAPVQTLTVWSSIVTGTVTVQPTANAGADQTVAEGATVTLDGGASVDPNNGGLTYSWSQTAGPTVTLSSASAAAPTFTAPQVLADSSLAFSLTVTDSASTVSSPDTVNVAVRAGINDPPTADAGDDLTATEGTWVRLDGGGSSDPERQPLAYSWAPPEGVRLTSTSARSPAFVAPNLAAGGTLTFSLTVNDGVQNSALADTVTVTVSADNDPPTARAGAALSVAEGRTATLDGSASSDPERQSLAYSWRQTAGPTVTLSSRSVARPTFTAPQFLRNTLLTFSLTVIDSGGAASQPARQVVTVSADDDPPTANAGADQTVDEGAAVTLDGGGSADPEGETLSYGWSQSGGPTVALSSSSAARPTFTAPALSEPAVLTFSLTVHDGRARATDTVKVTVEPLAGVTVSASSLAVAEGGVASYTVVLDSKPASGSVVEVGVSSDSGEVGVSADGGTTKAAGAALTFSRSNWNRPRTVIVSAAEDDDSFDDGATLSHSVNAAATTDDDYDSVTASDVTVTVTDNDTAGVKVSTTSLRMTEGGATSYTVALTAAPVLGSVVEVGVSSDSGEVMVSADGGTTKAASAALTFSRSNWNRPQTVTVSAAEDDDSVADSATLVQSVNATATTDDHYDSVTVENISVSVADNDVPNIDVSRSAALALAEGSSRSYDVRLAHRPGGDVVVRVSSGAAAVTVNKSGGTAGVRQDLTFTAQNWNRNQAVTLAAVEDDDTTDPAAVTITHEVLDGQSSDDYDAAANVTFTVNVTDDDVASMVVSRSATLVLAEGSSFGYDVRLAHRPGGDVVVRVSSGAAAVTVNKSGGTAGVRQDLTFTAQNWNRNQAVTLAAVEDDDTTDPAAVTITHEVLDGQSSDDYDAAANVTFTVNVTDDDVASMVVSRSATLVLAEGSSFGYDVRLAHRPGGDVVVRVSSGAAAVTVNKSGGTAGVRQDLTFTAENWNRDQAVTLAAVEDDDAADPAAVTITHEVLDGSSSDDYDDVADVAFEVTVTDDDVASMVVSRSAAPALAEGSSRSYDVKLAYRPGGDVVVRVSSGAAAVTVNKPGGTAGVRQDLTFTTQNWNRDQAVTLAAVEDDDAVDPAAVTITHEVLDGSSSDDYDNAADVTFDVAVTDNDRAGVAVSASSVNVTEEGSGVDYTVVLTSEPGAGSVTVDISSGDADAVKVRTGTGNASGSLALTFAKDDWNDAQTVTVTGVDDADSQNETVTLAQSIGTGSATEYSSVSVADVTVNVMDNDTPNLVVSRTTALELAEGGGSSTYNVKLATEPASDVVVEISSDNSDVTVKTGTGTAAASVRLTFTDSDWDDAQDVTVEAGSDDDSLDDVATITHGVVDESSSDEYDEVSSKTFTVTVTDNTLAGLSITDAEASEGAGKLDFTVTLSMASSRTVTVDWTLSAGNANPAEEGTATSGDYDATAASATTGSYDSGTKTGTLTFSSGQSLTQTVSVPVNDDFDVEADETVTVTLSGASGATVTDDSATGTIRNDDSAGANVSPERSLRTTAEDDDAGAVELMIAFSSRPSADVTVTVTSLDTTEGMVKESADDPDPTLDFTPDNWSAAQSVTVTGVDDGDLDGDVEYNVRLAFSTADAPGGDDNYRNLEPVDVAFTNLDDDLAIFSVSGGGEVTEGDSGTTALAEFTVTLAPAGKREVSVSYATSDGTAEAGSDYESASGTVTFPPGETSKTISVTVNGDDEAEGNETFTLALTSTPNGQIDPDNSSAGAVITNDDEKMVDAGMSGEFSVGETTVMVDSTLPEDTGLEVVLPSELESGGATIEELAVTLGPTDQEIDADLFGYAGNGEAHVLVDIDVSPVPDAAVRICLPITEGLRRAAGEQRLYLIRFYGGEWEALSSTIEGEMACADVRGFSPFAVVFEIDYAKRRVGEVNRAILPELSRAMTASTLEAITSRIDDAVSGGARGNSLNVPPPSQEPERPGPGLRLGELEDGETLSLLDAVDDSYFSVSLAGGYDPHRAEGEAEAVAAAPRQGGLGVWISGDYRNLSGGGGGLADWDGRVISGHLGADYRFGRGFLAGIATSWSQGSFDYTGRGEGSARVSGEYSSRMNSFHPYVGLSLSDKLSAWASAGWGFGEITVDDGEISGRQRAAARTGTLAAGANLRLLGDGATELSLKGEAWISRAEIKGNGGRVEGLAVKTNRLRAALEGSRALAIAKDSSLVPSLEFGVRRDGGDGETGVGGELAGGISLASSAGLTVEARGRGLLFHQGDSREWGVGGSVRFDPGGDGRGLSMSVIPSWGNGSSGVQGLWDGETAADFGTSASPRNFGLETEVGYGFPALGDRGLLTPYGAFGRPDPDSRSYRFGSRFSMNRTLDLTLEGIRRELRTEDPEHELTLQGRLSW